MRNMVKLKKAEFDQFKEVLRLKVLLYFEGMDKISRSGISKVLKYQQMALDAVGVDYTLDPDDDFDILHINTVFFNSEPIISKARKNGAAIVYNAHSMWHHYECKSRWYEDTSQKIKRFEGEIALFQEYWGGLLKEGDPYYNKNFPIEYGPFRLG